jgi:DNA invertase Pin-like site-specific DNA recombinase
VLPAILSAGQIGRQRTNLDGLCSSGSADEVSPPRQRDGQHDGEGRPVDTEKNDQIAALLAAKTSWTTIQDATGCSRSTIARIAHRAAG